MTSSLNRTLLIARTAGHDAACAHLIQTGAVRSLFALSLPPRDARWIPLCRVRWALRQRTLDAVAVRMYRRAM